MRQIELTNARGTVVRLADHGATLLGVELGGASGGVPLVLGPADPSELPDFPAAGATIGRVANRIADASFELDGIRYRLPANDGPHHLHGGPAGFGHRPWKIEAPGGDRPRSARLTLVSPDGDQGYPGRVLASVTFTLGAEDDLELASAATTSRPTPLSLTNHAYFNLAAVGDVLDHVFWVDADRWLPIDRTIVPTGEIASVDDTPFDFRAPRRIGERIAELEAAPAPGGYDHCLVFRADRDPERPCARLTDPASGRSLEIITDQPALQLYSANLLREVITRGGRRFGRHGAVCLETQHFPDAVHHPDFPSVILRPGETYATRTVLRFASS